MRYAEITNGIVTEVIECDDPSFAKQNNWVDISQVNPVPGVGWSFNGTWTPGAVTPPGQMEVHQAQASAQSTLLSLLATLPASLTQAQTDATAYPTADAATQGAIIVRLINQTAALAQGVNDLLVTLGITLQ